MALSSRAICYFLPFRTVFKIQSLKAFETRMIFNRSNSLRASDLSVKRQTVSKDSLNNSRKPIWYYDNMGIRKRKINQLMEINENNQNLAEDALHFQRLVKVLVGHNFEMNEITKILFNKPRILQMSKVHIEKKFKTFLQLGVPEEILKTMILKCPSLLLIDEKSTTIQKRINFLQELPLFPRLNQQRCTYLIQKCPNILLTSEYSAFQKKIKNLLSLGFNHQQLFELVMKHPALLTCSEESVKEKVNYIVDKMNGRLVLFVKFPRVFTASFKRIMERHLFLLDEGYMNSSTYLSENKLRAIVLPTDNDFVYRITQAKMKEYRDFQEKVVKGDITLEIIQSKLEMQSRKLNGDFDLNVESDETDDE